MSLTPPPDARPLLHDGDGWVACGCGARHWGRYGAAGLLLAFAGGAPDESGTASVGSTADGGRSGQAPPAVVLQHRALWSHHGGTWGIPGGALAPGESAADGAVREAVEEAGVPPDAVRIWAASALVHPDWSYTTVIGEATRRFTPRATDAESLEVAWVSAGHVADRALLPAFAEAWAWQAPLLARRVVVVVDGANVVGSRPDGWWRDRAEAGARLHARLAAMLPTGLPASTLELPADRWWPDVVLVLEGVAREADVGPDLEGSVTPTPAPSLAVVRAPRSGDDEIVARVRESGRPGAYTDAVVVTADRELAARVRAEGAAVVGPATFLAALP